MQMVSRWVPLALVAGGGVLTVATSAHAQASPGTVPCVARDNAITANNGNVTLNSASRVDS